MKEQRLIDANALLEKVEELIDKALSKACEQPIYSPWYNTFCEQLDERQTFRNMIRTAPTVEERPKGKRTKIYIVAKGNYALSNSMWAFSSKELADGFRNHLWKELDDGMSLNIFELEIDEAVLTEEDL